MAVRLDRAIVPHRSKYLSLNGKRRGLEELWRDLFSNTSEWWDHRPGKLNVKFPDFKHKQTGESLWLSDPRTPEWVQAELATVPPGELELNAFPWNIRLAQYAKAGQYTKTMEVFHQMQQEGIRSDSRTFLPVLNACAGLGALEEGKRVHFKILQVGCESNPYVGNCLVDMYAKCGSLVDARKVFSKLSRRDVVSWSAMIAGSVKSGEALKAMELFREMQQDGVKPNAVTFLGVLNACASLGSLEEGRRIHVQIVESGLESDVRVGSTLVDMYAKCGSIVDAQKMFNAMPTRNVVTWTAMIVAYVKSGQGLKALELFREMQQEGVEPNAVTFVGALNACASVSDLGQGRCIHEQISRSGCESNIFVGNSLIDMYAKCGSIEDARRVFNTMPTRTVVTWSAMIGGYAMHGHAKEAIELFDQMAEASVEINGITFLSLLSACSHGGLVKEGLRYFRSMISHFHIVPTKEHYSCMVDLLGRAGKLEDAEQLMKWIPLETGLSAWRSLLAACRVHGNIEIAERAAKRCLELDPDNASGYLLLSNIYASVGKWDRIAAIEREIEKGRVQEGPESPTKGD